MLASARLQTLVLTDRIADAERFYGGVLGLPLTGRSDGALLYDVGGGDLRVSPVPDWRPTDHTVFGFAVSDVRSAVRALAARGLVFERFTGFPHDDDAIVVTPDETLVAWFRDPDGNILSVVQLKAT
jgi:catechol 2,3-dioxygenase-like lactoylglutathione lyase family enzyme